MWRIAILLPEGTSLAGLEQARQGLLAANRYRHERRLPPVFEVLCVAPSPHVELDDGRVRLRVDATLAELGTVDMALVPPLYEAAIAALHDGMPWRSWLQHHRQHGGELASLCVGAALLAASGLLDGRQAVVHWVAVQAFRQRFPGVHWNSELTLLEHDGILTSGGATSSAHLVLRLIERHAGREAALWCAKLFQLDWSRRSQLPFAVFSAPDHTDTQVHAVQQYLERHHAQRLSVAGVAAHFALTRRTLERRFRQATGDSVLTYLQRARIEAAKLRLETTRDSVAQVMTAVGYLDEKAFRESFRKHCGLSPTAYRQRYAGAVLPY